MVYTSGLSYSFSECTILFDSFRECFFFNFIQGIFILFIAGDLSGEIVL